MLFSYGLLFILVLVIPMGLMNFDDNVSVQVFSFIIAIAIGIQWVVASIKMGWDYSRIPILSTDDGILGTTVGTIILNMGFTTVVPSWINIKKSDVSVQKVVWTAVTIGILFYTVLGISCTILYSKLIVAYATTPSECGTVFPYLQEHGYPLTLTRATISLYTYVMLVTSIPILCIVSHRNLIQNNVASKYVSIFLSFIVPWIITIPFQAGIGLQTFIAWYLDFTNFKDFGFFCCTSQFYCKCTL
jgi:hypothetical protein